MNGQTLNPQQIEEAILAGKIENVFKGCFVATDTEHDDYRFEIDGEVYHCENGRVRVQYDFQLSPKLLNILHIATLERSIEDQEASLKAKKDMLAKLLLQKAYDEKSDI